ncbi:DUF4844 domain-containing protein [Hymenobacter negativus]|uniref:DUF4844 domain-containing protein n=1 Tax=Hymenobacter negativus TaxID=2795026 RepID=A0ABS0QAT0_9BACT|nr:DUF4844 domain-containing protein [Hymenobacter negativus]MBH8559557.1 DUF4844 domain-containing protein [Hymenobacter negativus]
MKHAILAGLLTLGTLAANAQTGKIQVPAQAITQLEDLKELTKAEVAKVGKATKAHAEVRPDLNRYLVISADDFLRVTKEQPTKEAYLKCLDNGLARVAPLTETATDRQQVAEYFQELMEIVGLESSEGRLDSFVGAAGKARQ